MLVERSSDLPEDDPRDGEGRRRREVLALPTSRSDALVTLRRGFRP
jgi:hypothetical protein